MTLDRDDIVAGLGELAGELDAAGLELTTRAASNHVTRCVCVRS